MNKYILFLNLIVLSVTASAEDVNLGDKTEIHKIIRAEISVGSVTVASKFVGESIMDSTEIRYTISCAAGFKLDPKYKKSVLLQTYDYGANGKLSTYNAQTGELRIFHRSARIEDGGPVIDKDLTFTVNLKDACVK